MPRVVKDVNKIAHLSRFSVGQNFAVLNNEDLYHGDIEEKNALRNTDFRPYV